MKRIALIAALLVAWSTPAWAGTEAAKAAYDRGDYATAVREFREAAEQGNAIAQHYLGYMYSFGVGVPEDDAEAVKWFRKAANQGNAIARHYLGLLYGRGDGGGEESVWDNVRPTLMTPSQIAEAQRLARRWMAKRGQ